MPISTTHYRGYTINKEHYGNGYFYYAYGPKSTQGFTAKTLPSIKKAIDRRVGRGVARRARRNPLTPGQDWALIGLGALVLGGIVYALSSNKTVSIPSNYVPSPTPNPSPNLNPNPVAESPYYAPWIQQNAAAIGLTPQEYLDSGQAWNDIAAVGQGTYNGAPITPGS